MTSRASQRACSPSAARRRLDHRVRSGADVARAARGNGARASPAAIELAAAPSDVSLPVERYALPHAGARSALAPGRRPDRVLVQAGFFAVFFGLRGRDLPCEPLKTFPRNVRLSPLPKL